MLLPKYKGFEQEKKIGEYTILLPDPPDLNKIANYGVSKENQIFTRVNRPKDYLFMSTEDKMMFAENELGKKKDGFWFFNNGNLEYVTGHHYFYINWWFIDGKYPDWTDADRDFFYAWQIAEQNDRSTGLIYIANRREGKSYKGLSILYSRTIADFFRNGGIQSKTNTDAKKLFNKLIKSWKRLPEIFKPVDSGDASPKMSLMFEEPSRRNTKSQQKNYQVVLDSMIDYMPSVEEAYDGTKQHTNFQDEIGKTIEVDVDERMKILRECCMDGSKVIGKIIATTTVEEMEKKGGANCKKIWDKSSPTTVHPDTGMTASGLMRYFKPAYLGYRGDSSEGSFIDKYGYSNIPIAKKYLEGLRNSGEQSDQYSTKRKYPFIVDEAFYVDNKQSNFDLAKISQQMEFNKSNSHLGTKGNFVWKNGVRDSEVEWHPNENGRWTVFWMPKVEDRNKRIFRGGRPYPGNEFEGSFGCDPVDQSGTNDGKRSMFASVGIRGTQPLDMSTSNIVVCSYKNRLPVPEMHFEDMILQSVFYGYPILGERNKPGCINYFKQRGYYGEHTPQYIMSRTEETQVANSMRSKFQPWIPTASAEVTSLQLGFVQSFIYQHVGINDDTGNMGKFYCNDILVDCLTYDPNGRLNDFDMLVAFMFALTGIRRSIPKKQKSQAIYIPTYNNSGMQSELIYRK